MLPALGAGVLAGLAVAMPIGPMAMLIFERGSWLGFRAGAAAGLGVATADGLYAALAAATGAAIAAALAGSESELRVASAAVLLIVVAFGLTAAIRTDRHPEDDAPPPQPRNGRTFLAFLGLTAVNPPTIATFAAIIAGLPAVADAGTTAKVAFVAGAFAASAGWQTFIAGAGAVVGARLPAHARVWTAVAGYGIVTALAIAVLLAA